MDNEPHFEVYPQRHWQPTQRQEKGEYVPNGQFGWRFQAANGQVTAIGGEGFTREEDAEEAIRTFCATLGELIYESQTDAPSEIAVVIERVDQ